MLDAGTFVWKIFAFPCLFTRERTLLPVNNRNDNSRRKVFNVSGCVCGKMTRYAKFNNRKDDGVACLFSRLAFIIGDSLKLKLYGAKNFLRKIL